MVNQIMESLNTNPASNVLGGIVFENIVENATKLTSNITYKIRLSSTPRNKDGTEDGVDNSNGGTSDNSGNEWPTNQTFPFFQVVGPRSPNSTWGGKPGSYILTKPLPKCVTVRVDV